MIYDLILLSTQDSVLRLKNMVARIPKRGLRDFDWLLAFLAIGLVCFGTIQIRYAQPTQNYWVKQLIGLGIALVAMLAVAFNDYRKLINYAPLFYVFGLLLLVIVLIPGIGLKINGQRAWIRVPGNRTIPAIRVCQSNDCDDARALLRQAPSGNTNNQRSGHGLLDSGFAVLLDPARA